MKFTEITDYQLPGGRVTQFTPQAASSTFGWDPDDRPLTYDHEQHVRRAASGDNEISWLGAVFEVDEPLDTSAMNCALLAWHRRHEAFRTTATIAVDGAGDQHLVRRTCPSERLHFTSTDLGWIGPDDIATRLTALFDSELSPLQWPHCIVATVTDSVDPDDGGNRFLLVFAADHAVMDAYSMLLSIGELSTLYSAELNGHPVDLPEIGSHVDFSARDRSMGDEIDGDHEAVDRWRHFLARTGEFPALTSTGRTRSKPHLCGPVDVATSNGAAAHRDASAAVSTDRAALQSSWALPVADGMQVGAVNRLSRAAGHTTQTAVVAALALAHRRLTGESTLRLVMPMHTRHEAKFLESVGWYVGIGPLEVDVRHSLTFADALNAAAVGISEAKRVSRIPFPRVAELLGTLAEPQFVLSYLDLRFMSGAADWTKRRAQTLRSSARSDSEVYIWVVRTTDGITVSVRHPAGEAAMEVVRKLVVTTFDTLLGVIDDGIDTFVDTRTDADTESAVAVQPA